jgi:hypothetical protein
MYICIMEKDIIEKILKEKTLNLFSLEWYELTSNEIANKLLNKEGNGYVYIIRTLNSTHVKIGKTINITNRLKSLYTNIGDIYLFGYIYCVDYSKIETELHRKYKDKRIRGEWFDLSKEDIEDISNEYLFVNVNNIFNNTRIFDGILLSNVFDSISDDMFQICSSIETNTWIKNSDIQNKFNKLNITPKKIHLVLKKWALKSGYKFEKKVTSEGRQVKISPLV